MSDLTPVQQQRVEELFDHALQLSADARPEFIQSITDDADVRNELESLLAVHPSACARMETPLVEAESVIEAVDDLLADTALTGADPETVGPYRILRRLGEGGMGAVFLAEQEKPLRRRVALKLIKLGMDTRGVIGRFEAERQALARMNHPNVARALDAGATASGRPYFVMDYVDGIPITSFCDRERLDLSERLELFRAVCDAIQHAHQKGVIHRDIKPSNVLVSLENGSRVPKVIDFGVAKATTERLTDRTLHTRHGMMIGTPEYMSPEQADPAADVDTRTDIYALGVLLYEMLVGVLPFDTRPREGDRPTRDIPPAPPSSRLSKLGDIAEEAARKRGTNAHSLRRRVRGDLDWIVMKCLEPDRARRYATAAELNMDVGRFLRHEPVSAGPPGTSYRVARFVRRHRVPVFGGLVLIGVLLAGVVSTAVFALRESRQRAVAEAVSDFLNRELLAQASPDEQPDRDITLRTVLDRAAAKIEQQFSGPPLVEATLHMTIGDAYRGLGDFEPAVNHYQSALRLRAAELGEYHVDTFRCRYKIAIVLQEQGRFDEVTHELETLREQVIREFGEDDGLTMKVRIALGDAYDSQGRWADAEREWSEVVTTLRRQRPTDDADLLTTITNLGLLKQEQARWDESEPLLREAYETRMRVDGADSPTTLLSAASLGWLYVQMEKFADAESLLSQTVDRAAAVLGDKHPRTLSYKWLLAGLYEATDRQEEALQTQIEVTDGRHKFLGPEHPDTVRAMNSLAQLYVNMERLDDAEPLWREIRELTLRIHGASHPYTMAAIHGLSRVRRMQGHPQEALELSTEVVLLARSHLPPGHWYLGSFLTNYGKCLATVGRDNEASTALEEAYGIYKEKFGGEHERTQEIIRSLVQHHDRCGRPENAQRFEKLIVSGP